MILIIVKKLKSFSQNDYDSLIDHIKQNASDFFDTVLSPHSNAIFYGTYIRSIVSDHDNSRITIRVQRILDKTTNKVHSLIPSFLVPYSTVPLPYQINIISAEDDDIPDLSALYNLDLNDLLHIRSIFSSFWKNLFDWFSLPLNSFSITAFHLTHKQFMQSRGSVLSIYPPT